MVMLSMLLVAVTDWTVPASPSCQGALNPVCISHSTGFPSASSEPGGPEVTPGGQVPVPVSSPVSSSMVWHENSRFRLVMSVLASIICARIAASRSAAAFVPVYWTTLTLTVPKARCQ